MIKLNCRMRWTSKFPKLAQVAWADFAFHGTESCGHVFAQEAMEGSFSIVAKTSMEQVHGQRVDKHFCMACRW